MPSKNGNEKKPKKIKVRKLNYKRNIDDPNSKEGKEYKKKKDKNKKKGWKIFKICLFTFIALAVIGTGIVIGVLTGIIDKTESVDLEELKNYKLTTFIYDKDGKEIGNLFDEENRVNAKYEELPENLVNAVISIEDERFLKHGGVDIKRTMAAVVTYVFNGGESSFGGSTITQQLIKNITGDKEADWTRKIREWYRAFSIERILNKEEIMEAYLNRIYLGANASGVKVAARTYFDKDIAELNLAECATLAAIIQLPETYNPYRGEKNANLLKERKETVLGKMLELKYITKDEYNEAMKYEIAYKRGANTGAENVNSYYVEAAVEAVIEDIMEQNNLSKTEARQYVLTKGLRIYTPMDPKIQGAVDTAYSNTAYFYKDKAGDFMQSAAVIIENGTGNVVALSGGAGEKVGNRTLNRATDLPRQPGSAFKPIAAYGPTFEKGLAYPGMGFDDSQINVNNWKPKNYYGYFNGYVSVRNAINQSMNIPAVRAMQLGGIDYAYEFAERIGITTLVPTGKNNDKNLSTALGGLTTGATVFDMAVAYTTFANGGLYIEPKLYTKVTDSDGKDILVKKGEAKRVMKDTTAYLMTDCLVDVIDRGTGTRAKQSTGIKAAGKTGNSNDDKDQWFCGYTPYYTTAVWNGYDQVGDKKAAKPINRAYPYTCIKIWDDIMEAANAGHEVKGFAEPKGIVKAEVCTSSGKIPTGACAKYGGVVRSDMFASGTVPTEKCAVHKMVTICKASGLVANEYCPKDQVEERAFITRDENPAIKPRDWGRMVIKELCNIHTKSSSGNNGGGNVNPYGSR